MYLKEETQHTLIIEKSRFICYMKHLHTEAEFRDYLAGIRKKYYDATHVCSAFLCHNLQRSSDDGEPAGTAGAPILNVLQKSGMDEMCAIVVRYFGGIQLGAGGLIRAYGSAVSECIKDGITVEDVSYPRYELKVSYETASRLDHFLRNRTILLDTRYDTDVTFVFALDQEEKLQNIIELTRGIVPVQTGEEIIQKVVE